MNTQTETEGRVYSNEALSLRKSNFPPDSTLPNGWLSQIPAAWVPYAQLMRLDRPNGFWYFYLPHLFGSLHAGTHLAVPARSLLYINLILLVGTLIMRGATCTWNDTVDAPFDRLVPRCKNRPVARGAVSPTSAHIFTAVQSVISLGILTLLPPVSFIYAIPAIVGWALYPLAKQVTDYPQVVLGFPMAWGIFMGSVAIGADPLQITSDTTSASSPQQRYTLSTWALYTANVFWTLFYEIIYSHQDAAHDANAGVENIVLLYDGKTKPLLVKLALGQVLLLASVGWLSQAGWVYWIATVCGSAATLMVILMNVKLDVPESCGWWFKVGCCGFTGTTMAAGLLGEYLRMAKIW